MDSLIDTIEDTCLIGNEVIVTCTGGCGTILNNFRTFDLLVRAAALCLNIVAFLLLSRVSVTLFADASSHSVEEVIGIECCGSL